MSAENLDKFQKLALTNPALQAKLKEARDQASFANRVVELGKENGLIFTAEEVSARITAAAQKKATGGELSDKELDLVAAAAISFGDSLLCGYCGKTSGSFKLPV